MKKIVAIVPMKLNNQRIACRKTRKRLPTASRFAIIFISTLLKIAKN